MTGMTKRRWFAGAGLATLLLCAGANAAEPVSQAALPITINDGYDSKDALVFDWPTIQIGTGQYEDGPTGLTVFRFARRVFAAIDVRGGGPGTVNSDYLRLGYRSAEVDAVVFSGGSWYGLEAVTAVNSALKDEGYRGGHWDNVGLSVGSIIYDFGGRRLNEIYPDKRLAQAALKAVRPGVFPRGPYGAGRSTMTGSLFGCNAHAGQGGAFRQIGELKIAAFTIVNALGVVTDREGRTAACYADTAWPKPLRTQDILAGTPASGKPGWTGRPFGAPDAASGNAGERKNTTISLIVVNQAMDPADLQRLAIQVHTSMGRGLQPFQTQSDGDVLYAVSTAEYDPPEAQRMIGPDIGIVASELMWDAILSSTPAQPEALRTVDNAVPIKPAQLRSLAGRYGISPIVELEVTAVDGKLMARASGERRIFGIPRDNAVEMVQAASGDFVVTGRYRTVLRFDKAGGLIVNPGRWQQAGRKLR